MVAFALDHSDPCALASLQTSVMLSSMLHVVDNVKHSCMCCMVVCNWFNSTYIFINAGPGGYVGGSMFGSATDGERMYVAVNKRPDP